MCAKICDFLKNWYKETIAHRAISTMTSSAVANTPSQNSQGCSDFLTYLRSKFNDEEASAFSSSFAIFLQEKTDEFCIDLDEAYKWLGYSRKDTAVTLLTKAKMEENTDYLLQRSLEHRKPDKYMFKTRLIQKAALICTDKHFQKSSQVLHQDRKSYPGVSVRGWHAILATALAKGNGRLLL